MKEESISETSDSQLIVLCNLSPEEQEKKCFADRVRKYIFNVWILVVLAGDTSDCNEN